MIRRAARLSRFAGVLGLVAMPALAQSWAMVDSEGDAGAGAYICPVDEAETGNLLCLRLGCSETDPLHFELDIGPDAAPEALDVGISVDGQAAGELAFTKRASEGFAAFTAPFDPRLHRDLIARLRQGIRASLAFELGDQAQQVALSLRGSSRTLGAVLDTCPMPEVPLDDPAAVVLDQIRAECAALGGTIAMEPGFERREDLDGDGRDDVVIDYAAAVCSEMASLYCGSGGCTVGFFLARGEAYKRLFDGVIRGYAVKPGGRLALDLHGTACGLYGFEACRKIFDITDDNFTLVEELAGTVAEDAMAADEATGAASGAATDGPENGETGKAEAPEAPAEPAAPPDVADDTATGAMDDGATAPEPVADAGIAAEPVAPDGADDTAPGATAVGAAAPEPGATVEPAAPDTAPAPAADTPAPASDAGDVVDDNPTAAPATGLEWIGDGGSVFVPPEGESLPDDLSPAPVGTAPGENPGTTR